MRFLLLLLLSTVALAEKADIKLKGVDTSKDTSIIIKKGETTTTCEAYEIVSGSEDVVGESEFDKSKARQNWKSECKEWQNNLKELNKDNKIIVLSCGSPEMTRDSDGKTSVSSIANYKIRVRVLENQK